MLVSSLVFRRFKALRSTALSMQPFNLFIGPNGSGKTSLIEALLRLRTLTALAPEAATPGGSAPATWHSDRAEVTFEFAPPFADVRATMGCVSEFVCDSAAFAWKEGSAPERWQALRRAIAGIRVYFFSHAALAEPATWAPGCELQKDGGRLPAALHELRRVAPERFASLEADFCRTWPEYRGLDVRSLGGEGWALSALLAGETGRVEAADLSQGTLYFLGMLLLAHHPSPPTVVCIEEIDRGLHPRLLRHVRDTLYRLSHPETFGDARPAVQVVATTHAPYLLDLFDEHPEEIVIAHKRGSEARFERLSERPGLSELLEEATLGELWFSGVLGGVPEAPGTSD